MKVWVRHCMQTAQHLKTQLRSAAIHGFNPKILFLTNAGSSFPLRLLVHIIVDNDEMMDSN